MNFIDKWLCCAKVDEESVVANVRCVRLNPDGLAEACLAYNHDPKERHFTVNPAVVWIGDNGAPRVNVVQVGEPNPQPALDLFVDAEVLALMAQMVEQIECEADAYEKGQEEQMEPAIHVEPYTHMEQVAQVDPQGQLVQPGQQPRGRAPGPADEELVAPLGEEPVEEGPSSVYTCCQDVIEVKSHRRLPHAQRGNYVASVVSEIKNKLGCPAANAANLLAVRRMANNIMRNHGVRPTHIRSVIEVIIAGVFVPDEMDLSAAKMLQSVGVKELREELSDAGPKSVWTQLFNPFKRRGAARVRE